MPKIASLLLNLGHALDHLFLLIFATAVSAIATEFGVGRWEDMMPYTVGAFVMFGLGSIPAGRLGDLWGRRQMMLVFFFGMGLSALAVALTQTPLQMGIALTVLGVFSAIYHPVGIPMLVQKAEKPGLTIGINGLAGNLGIAMAALSTGFLVAWQGWRMAFIVPAMVSILCGILFARTAPHEMTAPAKKKTSVVQLPKHLAWRTFVVMVATSTTSSLLFNITTNGNTQLLAERLDGLVNDPTRLGMLLALIYAVASLAQLVVGRLLDWLPVKPLFFSVLFLQIVSFALASQTAGWVWYVAAIGYMVMVFAAIPFSDTMVVRYIDDAMRSRVSGTRIAISFGISSLAVYSLGPFVKASGFTQLMVAASCVAAVGALIVLFLPNEAQMKSTAV
ncbi:MAG: MFS transporter [Betaproteobacteria bacterium]|jgi:MFS family permease|nr:MFS transporter [Betaproteobacteria bacterium]NDD02190.1 MFS transporter [Betaproteobacteria bacterium]NDD22889.1 MFS transporter [Betaproteobacteria bacterium]NDF78345.1 MFS transporter [Betaproteobacteria bacterium]